MNFQSRIIDLHIIDAPSNNYGRIGVSEAVALQFRLRDTDINLVPQREALMPRMMRSCPESHYRKADAIRDSRIASSPKFKFQLCEACVLGGGDGRSPASS